MKLGFLIASDTPVNEWITFAEQHNIDGIELLFKGSTENGLNADELASLFRKTYVEPCACGLWHVNTISPIKEELEKNRKTICSFLDLNAKIGCKTAFINSGEYDNNDIDKTIDVFSEEYSYYNDYAKKNGITLACYLGHKGNFINSREILSKVIKAVPSFKIKVDPVGIIRNLKDVPYEIIQLFGNKIAHFHAKDNYVRPGFEMEPPVGMGDLKWNNIIAMLYNAGYNGYIVIEPHGPMYNYAIKENFWKYILLSKRHLEQFLI